MTRKIFAILAAVVAVFVAVAMGDDEASDGRLVLNDPVQFVREVDRLLDRVGEEQFDGSGSAALVAEIVPFFAEEGITDTPRYARLIYQTQEGTRAQHLGGYTYCGDVIYVNSRYLNPYSPWFRRPDTLATIVHELAHVQQGFNCRVFKSEDVESAAQLMSFEILAAMANAGNRAALVSLLNELRSVALGHLRYEARGNYLKTQRLIALQREIFTPSEWARRDASRRFWHRDVRSEREFVDILYKYSSVPFDKLRAGVEDGVIEDLVMAPPRIPWSTPGSMRSELRVDDLAYLLEHAGEIIDEMLGAAS